MKKSATTIIEKVQTNAREVKESEIMQRAQTQTKNLISKAEALTKETSSKVKTKLDEKGVTEFASTAADKVTTGTKLLGGFLFSKAKQASSVVNEKIDKNEKLAQARDTTKEKVN